MDDQPQYKSTPAKVLPSFTIHVLFDNGAHKHEDVFYFFANSPEEALGKAKAGIAGIKEDFGSGMEFLPAVNFRVLNG